jgi:hypothetical protein
VIRRQLLARRYWDRIKERRQRLSKGTLFSYEAVPPPWFIDYWADLPATIPEKLLFAELVRRQITFYFSYYFGDMPFTKGEVEHYRPDFLLPDFRIIIEVAGVYWHTRPGMWEYDATRIGLFEAAGYKVYIFTDYEVMADPIKCIDSIPECFAPAIRGGRVIIGDRPMDPRRAVTARLRKYPKVVRLRYRKRVKGDTGIISAYRPGGARPKAIHPIDILVTHETIDEEYLRQMREYGLNWLDYINELTKWFKTDTRAKREAYPSLWAYWKRWKDWWWRFQ